MCGRFTLRAKLNVLLREFACEFAAATEPSPRFNIAPTQDVAIVRRTPGLPGRQLTFARWGLIPAWSQDPAIGARMINARSETVAEKPSFRQAFRKRRCLIPADGYYEWQKLGRGKQPYLIHFADDRPFAFAGLWEAWSGPYKDTTVAWDTCSVITTAANALTRSIHDRMPVIVEPGDYDRWLDPAVTEPTALSDLLPPREIAGLTATPVTLHVNSPTHDDEACVRPAPAT